MTIDSIAGPRRVARAAEARPFACLYVLATCLLAAGCATAPARRSAQGPELRRIEEQWGIELRGIRLSAAGYMLDFRYRVIDPQKAVPIFKRQNKPVLIDKETGTRFFVPTPPTTGPLRNSYTPQVGRTYFMLFGNPGRYIKPGRKVEVQIGEFRAEHLVVQ